MLQSPSKQRRTRYGMVAVYVAISLSMFMGVLALAIDASHMYDDHRKSQNAVDAAALAAATQMYADWNTGAGIVSPAAKESAKTTAASYGFTDGSGGVTVTVAQPTATPFNQLGYVQVTINYPQKTFFIGANAAALQAEGQTPATNGQNLSGTVTAIARGGMFPPTTGPAILAMNKTYTQPTLDITGGATAWVPDNASIAVNNPNAGGLTLDGSGSSAKGGSIYLSGPSYSGSGNITNNEGQSVTPTYNQAALQDPYANMATPSTSGRATQAAVKTTDSTNLTLSPGVYPSIVATGSGNITFQPGVYIITGGNSGEGLTLTGNGNISVVPSTDPSYVASSETGAGVFFYFTGGTAKLTGNGSAFNLPAPTTGAYAGMSIWVDKNNPDANAKNKTQDNTGIQLAGNGNMNIGGVVYGPTTAAVVSGNGDAMGQRLITDTITVNGNGVVKFGFSGPPTPPVKELGLVY